MWEGRVRDVTLITFHIKHVSSDALPMLHLFTCSSSTHKLTQIYTHSAPHSHEQTVTECFHPTEGQNVTAFTVEHLCSSSHRKKVQVENKNL